MKTIIILSVIALVLNCVWFYSEQINDFFCSSAEGTKWIRQKHKIISWIGYVLLNLIPFVSLILFIASIIVTIGFAFKDVYDSSYYMRYYWLSFDILEKKHGHKFFDFLDKKI